MVIAEMRKLNQKRNLEVKRSKEFLRALFNRKLDN